ncbi:MAG: hypothetical protein ACJ8C4_01160 [Gemmataceae bacterium]
METEIKRRPLRFQLVLALACFLLVLLVFSWVVVFFDAYDVAKAEALNRYDQMTPGMTRKQVEAMMVDCRFAKELTYGPYISWNFEGRYDLTAGFHGDVLDSKSLYPIGIQSNSNFPVWLQKLPPWLKYDEGRSFWKRK